jgi:hypothetical protein
MDVAETSDVRISKKRTTETAETAEIVSTLGTLATWGGTTLTEAAEDTFTICSSCQSLLIRPACDPKSQQGSYFTKKEFMVHRSLSAVSSSALGGCIVCRLAISAKPTLPQYQGSSVDGFHLALYWIDAFEKFTRIDVTPVNYFNGKLSFRGNSFRGNLNAIRLVSVNGISLGLYSRTGLREADCI